MKYPMWYCNWTRFVQRCMIKYLEKRGWRVEWRKEGNVVWTQDGYGYWTNYSID